MDLYIAYNWTVSLKCRKKGASKYFKKVFEVIGEDDDWAIRGAMTKASEMGYEAFYVIVCKPKGIAIAFDRLSPKVELLCESELQRLWKIDPLNSNENHD